MKIFKPTYFEDFQKSVITHNIKSGEIILLIYEHGKKRYDFKTLIQNFFKETNIQTEDTNYIVTKHKRNEAMESIKYGLSTKVNYTCIDTEFTDSEKNRYSNGFFEFFNNPDYYAVDTRIFKNELDLNDFWEVGGSILIDDDKIGIFWINDLYDKFNYST